jgi:polysaccharide export outer membrane protein
MILNSFLAALCVGLLATADAADQAVAPAPAYKIGIQDVLGIVVWNEPALSLDVQVRPDGKITVPLLHDVEVVGEAPEQVAASLAARLSEFVNSPNVTVIVRQINSYTVYFLGEVLAPGALPFYRPTRILQGIAAAGGLTEFSKKEITLLREVGGIEKRYQIDLKKLIAGDPGQENMFLLPDDTLLFH